MLSRSCSLVVRRLLAFGILVLELLMAFFLRLPIREVALSFVVGSGVPYQRVALALCEHNVSLNFSVMPTLPCADRV